MATFSGLLDTLLNISKLESGTIKPVYTLINVNRIIQWLDQNFAPLANEKRIGFKLHFPLKGQLFVRSDVGLLESILMNLVSNAIKFTSKGAILVSVRKRGSEVSFQVWDSGAGIADEDLEHIFAEFYQIDNPQRDRAKGFGLGLAIVRRTAMLLCGNISCRSRVGHGSVFEFRLPLDNTSFEKTQQADMMVLPKGAIGGSFARGKHFVVVKDDVLVAQAMTGLLEGMGGEVQHFDNAEVAVQHDKIESADYYIADYMLAGKLNGVQFPDRLRQKKDRPIKAVLLTGDTSTAFIREAADCEWPVLFKPVNTARLISSLSAQGRRGRSRRSPDTQ